MSFAEAGEHRIAARLEADAVAPTTPATPSSSFRPRCRCCWSTATPAGGDAKYLGWALSPGGKVRTGVRPRIETPRFLANRTAGRIPRHRRGQLRPPGPLGRRGPGALRGRRRRRGLLPRRADPQRFHQPRPVSRRQGAVPRAAGRARRPPGRSPGKDPRHAGRGPFPLPLPRRARTSTSARYRPAVLCGGEGLAPGGGRPGGGPKTGRRDSPFSPDESGQPPRRAAGALLRLVERQLCGKVRPGASWPSSPPPPRSGTTGPPTTRPAPSRWSSATCSPTCRGGRPRQYRSTVGEPLDAEPGRIAVPAAGAVRRRRRAAMPARRPPPMPCPAATAN